MNGFKLLIFALAFACFASFALGVRWKFFSLHSSSGSAALKVLMAGAGLTAVAELLAIIRAPPFTVARFWGGLALFLGALALFFYTGATVRRRPLTVIYSKDEPGHLVQQGPYRWVRHPFYVSYLLSYVAGWVATGALWLVPFLVLMTLLYAAAARGEERKFLESPLADAYRAYRGQAGMFLPRLWKTSRAEVAPVPPRV